MGYGQYSPSGGAVSRETARSRGKVRRDVTHAWAHRLAPTGRNSTGTLYFDGDTIYSYGAHFPIARHVSRGGKACVLFTTRDYSVTTSRHKSDVRSAIPDAVPVFRVEDVRATPGAATMKLYAARLAKALERAARARTHTEWALRDAERIVEEANSFAALFGFKTRLAVPGNLDAVRAKVQANAVAAREAVRKQRAREAIERTARLREWTGDATLTYTHGKDYMRVSGPNVETTRHAVVSVEDVRKVGPMVCAMLAAGRTYKRNGERIEVGPYVLDEITTTEVRVGCHTFTRAECERITALVLRTAAA